MRSEAASDGVGAGTTVIAVLLGDGIGPEIVKATMRVLQEACAVNDARIQFDILPSGLTSVESHGSTLPAETKAALPGYRGWILGPVSHHEYPIGDTRFPNPSGYLRKSYSLYANVRPARSLPGVNCLRNDIDLVIVRENTQGFYADRAVLDGNGELRPDEDTVMSVRVITRAACLRIAKHAFELARARGRQRKVTAVHKANVLRRGDGLFLDCCRTVADSFPDIEFGDLHVDACAMHLVMRPQIFDVVVTTNMFGDILSDEAAGLVGGLGMAPGLNVGDEHAMAQATHGSAPDIAPRNIGNPVAEILSGRMLLSWLAEGAGNAGLRAAADTVEAAVLETLAQGRDLTPDLGGTATTALMTDRIVDRIARR